MSDLPPEILNVTIRNFFIAVGQFISATEGLPLIVAPANPHNLATLTHAGAADARAAHDPRRVQTRANPAVLGQQEAPPAHVRR